MENLKCEFYLPKRAACLSRAQRDQEGRFFQDSFWQVTYSTVNVIICLGTTNPPGAKLLMLSKTGQGNKEYELVQPLAALTKEELGKGRPTIS